MRKIMIGSLFFVLSLLLLVVIQARPLQGAGMDVAIILLSAGCLACSMFLGLLGAGLMEAKFPG